MDSLLEIKEAIDTFAEERDWTKFHTPANLAKSISIEANELLECFQWDEQNYDISAVKEELADVINYCMRLSSVLDLEIKEIVMDKLEKNNLKYPIDKAYGKSLKYTEYED